MRLEGTKQGEKFKENICNITGSETLVDAVHWFYNEALDATKKMIKNSEYFNKVKTSPEIVVSDFINYLGDIQREHDLDERALYFLSKFEDSLGRQRNLELSREYEIMLGYSSFN